MKSTDLPDATARALDLLPPGDPASSDPCMLRDSRLAEEARLTRETAADVWLAVSPLRVAPPEVLQEVLAEIHPPAPAKLHGARRAMPWLAAAGWAAAAAIALLLWPRHQYSGLPAPAAPANQNASNKNTATPRETQPVPPHSTRDERQRSEINRLRGQLSRIRDDEHTSRLPRIIGLKAPGAADHSPVEVRKRVRLILADALRSSLEAESGAPSDPAAIVIERGWPQGGVPAPAEGETIRHRHFPEHNWQDLGFLRSSEGEFYDPANHTVWSASPDGRGFTGRRADDTGEIARFSNETDTIAKPLPKPRTEPEGFIVENPDDNTADVIIDNLPAPTPGTKQVAVIRDTAGNTQTIPVTPEIKDPNGPNIEAVANLHDEEMPELGKGEIPLVAANASDSSFIYYGGMRPNSTSTAVFNIGSILNLASFQVIELPLVPNGQPGRIIIQSHP